MVGCQDCALADGDAAAVGAAVFGLADLGFAFEASTLISGSTPCASDGRLNNPL
jgi:hypothetical protein